MSLDEIQHAPDPTVLYKTGLHGFSSLMRLTTGADPIIQASLPEYKLSRVLPERPAVVSNNDWKFGEFLNTLLYEFFSDI